MADYQFSTVWRVEASIQEVWDVFSHPDQWPEWWGSLERIVEIKKVMYRALGRCIVIPERSASLSLNL